MLTAALGRLFAVAEAYPQLRATENFQQLQAQLSDVEQNIAVSRQVYNDTVLELRQRARDRADEHHRRHLQLQAARVLPDRGRDARRRRGRLRPAPAAPPRPPRRSRRASGAEPAGELARMREGAARWRRRSPRSSCPARGRERYYLPQRRHRRPGRAGRLAARRREHHDHGRLPRRLPRHPAPQGRVDRPDPGQRAGQEVHPRRQHRARLASTRRDTFNYELHEQQGADRLALPGRRRGRTLTRSPTASAGSRSPTTTSSTST